MAESGEQSEAAGSDVETGQLARVLSSFQTVVTAVAVVWLVVMQYLMATAFARTAIGCIVGGAQLAVMSAILHYVIALVAAWRQTPVMERYGVAMGRMGLVFAGISLLSILALILSWSPVLGVAMLAVMDVTFVLWLPRIQGRSNGRDQLQNH